MIHGWLCRKSVGILILRLVIGFVFIMHGAQKMTNNFAAWYDMSGAIAFFAQIGFASFWAYLDVFAEIIAGIAILLGVFTRYAAIALSIVMIVAIYVKLHFLGVQAAAANQAISWYVKYFQVEQEFVLLGASLALMFIGSGKLSLWRACPCQKTGVHSKVCSMVGCGDCHDGVCEKSGSAQM